MHPSSWVRITSVENLPEREGRNVRLGELDIAIFNLGDRCVAVENRCPHRDGPLVDGIVSNLGGRLTVTCPLHTRRICLDTGETVKPSGEDMVCVRTFRVKVENGIVMVDLAAADRKGPVDEAA